MLSKWKWNHKIASLHYCMIAFKLDREYICKYLDPSQLKSLNPPRLPTPALRPLPAFSPAHFSAVYNGIKKPESFSHSGFSLKVARQLPLNTPKNPNRKTHLRSVIFWNSAEISLVFCQCKRSLQSRRYYSGFWSRGTWPSAESPDRGPRRKAHYTCTVKGREKSRMRTTYQNTSTMYEIRVFSRMRFSCQAPPNVMGFSGSVNGTTKNPGFLDFGFCPCKWAFCDSLPHFRQSQ